LIVLNVVGAVLLVVIHLRNTVWNSISTIIQQRKSLNNSKEMNGTGVISVASVVPEGTTGTEAVEIPEIHIESSSIPTDSRKSSFVRLN
jgi:hypothetical protein